MFWIIITQLWGVRFTPLSASDTIRGYKVIQTSDGGYAIAGSFKTTTGTYPVYIKMDNNGNVQVVKRYSITYLPTSLNISPSCYPTPVSANEKGNSSLSNYYKVYTVDGKLVKEGFGSEIKLKRGLYIIKYENKTEKIIIK